MSRVQHIRGRPTKYRSSLRNNDYWNIVKREVKLRDKHKCKHCGKDYNLEIHHITYFVNGQSIVGKELKHLNCLICVCENCHSKIHNK